jgi:hypothetical protein
VTAFLPFSARPQRSFRGDAGFFACGFRPFAVFYISYHKTAKKSMKKQTKGKECCQNAAAPQENEQD